MASLTWMLGLLSLFVCSQPDLPAVSRTHEALPHLGVFALAVPTTWRALAPGIPLANTRTLFSSLLAFSVRPALNILFNSANGHVSTPNPLILLLYSIALVFSRRDGTYLFIMLNSCLLCFLPLASKFMEVEVFLLFACWCITSS